MRGRGAVRIRHRANRIYHCSDHGYSLNWLMSIFRSPGMLTFVHFALGILLIAAMAAHPALIERPIAVVGNRAAVGRPLDNIEALLP